MLNPIKYSTTSEPLSLNKGNFYFGTGDDGKGPSDSTGYYNGFPPSVGGYIIYMYKEDAPGSLSYHNAPTDNDLISFTNSLAQTSYTTADECLAYFSSQDNMVAFNKNYEGIVTDGLVLNLDAGFVSSYPKGGTGWRDLSGGGNNGTLINGPTFSTSGGGSIVFDGVDDYVTLGTPGLITDDFCIVLWFKTSVGKSQYYFSTGYNSQPTILIFDGGVWIGGTATENRQSIGSTKTGKPVCVVVNRYNKESKVYLNNVLQSTNTVNVVLSTNTQYTIGHAIPRNNNFTYFQGEFYVTQIYNRALSELEITQNYYAGLQRFIPTDGLVLSLDAQNTNTTTNITHDTSGDNNNGTLLNGVQYVSDGNGSWSFDGVDDYAGLLFTYNTQNTVSFWIKFTGEINNVRAIIDMGNITPTFRIYLQNQKVKVQYEAAFAATGLYSTDEVITDTWVNYTITNIGNNTSIYTNGILDNSGILPLSPITTPSQLGIAGKPGGSSSAIQYLKCNISQILIYHRALTQEEISTIYNATKTRYGI